MHLYDSIFKRKSTRKYQPALLPQEQLTQISDFIKEIKPLHPEIKTQFELVGASETKGMVSAKAPHFLLVYSEVKDGYLTNVGFMLQQADLYLSSLGLGSCWLGMAKTNAPKKNGLEYIIMLAFGKAQANPYRMELSGFKRKALSEIASGNDERLEAVRLAPSATNSQPWYFVCDAGRIYVYRKKLGILKFAMYDTMNQIDMGIGLCHLWLASEKANQPFAFTAEHDGAPNINGYTCIGVVS